MVCRMTISVAQIMKHCTVNNEWLKTKEQRAGWIQRFEEEIAGIRRNLAIEQSAFDAGEENWHRDWAEGRLKYLKREIKKREKYIESLKALDAVASGV